MRYYFLGQSLWDIVGGSNATPSTDAKPTKIRKVKARRSMYALTDNNRR